MSVCRLTLPESIGHGNAEALLLQMQQQLQRQLSAGNVDRVEVDAAALQQFDSSALTVLLAHATQVVEKDGVRRVGLDAGMHSLARPALYDAWHDVVNLQRLAEQADGCFDVVGPICESSDVLGRDRPLPSATVPGEVILIADAGAYGYAMASHYNLRGLPAEDVIDDPAH